MTKLDLLGVSALALFAATPFAATSAFAQSTTPQADDGADASGEIIVTAQRQAQSLQDVPIAVSAFSAESLERQQIDNASDLQLTLPNVTFSKGNFTGSSFTIRGVGDLCVGVSCDSATAIHLDGTPLLGTRLFETEYFDLERIEVLRGPQGTLFGRNATSGVVNIIPARPDLNGFKASGEAEYGNFNSIKAKGMVNVALGDTIGVRVAGFYLKRDGYTKNLFDGDDFDGRDMYAVRGSIRWQPSDTTTVDLSGYYFRENDDRLRIQKQLCQRDPTGILGCLNNRREFGITNANSTFTGVLSSAQFLAIRGLPTAFALGNLYSGTDAYANNVNPTDVRTVNTDYTPSYFADEQAYQARIEQDIGSFKAQLTGFYHKTRVDSSQDYNLSVANRALYAPALNSLAFFAANGVPTGIPSPAFVPGSAAYFAAFANAIIPNGPNGNLCTSLAEPSGTGAFTGQRLCSATPQDFDRSNQTNSDWSVEGIITSDFDGPFNFLLGGIYVDSKLTENSYYVNSFSIDYLAGLLGAFGGIASRNPATGAYALPPAYLATPYFRNNTDQLNVKSYGIFGEGYYEFSDKLKLTLGLRYNSDKKYVRARSSLLTDANNAGVVVAYGATDWTQALTFPTNDFDVNTPGRQAFTERRVSFSEWTGRAVLDYKITEDNLLYASYSRGYKSGGVNPPVQAGLNATQFFDPEFIDSFEIGSKNSFMNGKLLFNLTAFYYKYKALQLSRIVARTSVNDNVDADIYGLEADAVIRPSRELAVNLGFSYLHTKVSSDKFLANPRDPSGGRSDAVIIKDITNGSNCAVTPTTAGNVAGVNGYVNQINTLINAGAFAAQGVAGGAGLQPTQSFDPDSNIAGRGAFGICAILQAAAPTVGAAFGGVSVPLEGVAVNIKGNKLPQAPNYKFSAGVQYTGEFGNGMSLVPRVDLTYTGDSYGNIFNGRVNKVKGYAQANAQIQLNGNDDRWFLRGFVQNIFDSDSTTGLYVTDQSSGLFTNIFTLEPRRYGIAAGFKF